MTDCSGTGAVAAEGAHGKEAPFQEGVNCMDGSYLERKASVQDKAIPLGDVG